MSSGGTARAGDATQQHQKRTTRTHARTDEGDAHEFAVARVEDLLAVQVPAAADDVAAQQRLPVRPLQDRRSLAGTAQSKA